MKTKDALHLEAKHPISESVRKRNPHLYPAINQLLSDEDEPTPPKPWSEICKPRKRIRQSSKPLMNKLETEYYSILKERFEPKHKVHCQAMSLMLGNGIKYKADFVIFGDMSFGKTTAYEVKGDFAFRGGFENLKVAAHQYPEIHFILVWKEGGEWRNQEVLP